MPVAPQRRPRKGEEPEPVINKRFYLDVPTNRRLRELARAKESTESAQIREALSKHLTENNA